MNLINVSILDKPENVFISLINVCDIDEVFWQSMNEPVGKGVPFEMLLIFVSSLLLFFKPWNTFNPFHMSLFSWESCYGCLNVPSTLGYDWYGWVWWVWVGAGYDGYGWEPYFGLTLDLIKRRSPSVPWCCFAVLHLMIETIQPLHSADYWTVTPARGSSYTALCNAVGCMRIQNTKKGTQNENTK